ncbi:MAG: hypothetical protein ACRC6E_02220 [Fusobacteriaceae bacterium]
MRTREQELEFQVRYIFEEFYKERIIDKDVTSFKLTSVEFKDMLSVEFNDSEKGRFFSNKANAEIFYKFIFTEIDIIILFVMMSI